MQRILRINLLARNHALKNERKKNLKKLRDDWREYEFRKAAIEKIRNEYIRAERKHRREDWMAGPLAPKRDVGTRQEFYATVSSYLQAGPAVPPQARRGPKGNGWDSVGSEGLEGEHKEWEGVGNEGNIVEGDRVCIVRGNSSLIGQIGKVVDLNAEAKEVKVEGLNMVRSSSFLATCAPQDKSNALTTIRPTWKYLKARIIGKEFASSPQSSQSLSPT